MAPKPHFVEGLTHLHFSLYTQVKTWEYSGFGWSAKFCDSEGWWSKKLCDSVGGWHCHTPAHDTPQFPSSACYLPCAPCQTIDNCSWSIVSIIWQAAQNICQAGQSICQAYTKHLADKYKASDRCLSDVWFFRAKASVKHIQSIWQTSTKHLTDVCQMLCTCLSDALYMLDTCFGLLDRCFGLLVRCLMETMVYY